jgi:hypothetical protein
MRMVPHVIRGKQWVVIFSIENFFEYRFRVARDDAFGG